MSCRLCNKDKLTSILSLGNQPIAHRFLSEPRDGEFKHPLDVVFCESCGFMQIDNPISPEELYSEYFCLSSWKWQPHQDRLIEIIKGLPDLSKDAQIIEIGSNDGGFIENLNNNGYKNVLGIEPAKDAFDAAISKQVPTINKYLTSDYANELVEENGQYDLVIARQVLEHIADLKDFRDAIKTLCKQTAYVLIEVPHFEFSMDEGDYTGIWEEHVNYFTLDTLKYYFAEVGIEINYSETFNFSGEALIVLGKNMVHEKFVDQEYVNQLRHKAYRYRDYWPKFQGAFKDFLSEEIQAGKKIAIYGAGCRSCSMINFADIKEYIEVMIDDQQEKQGKYMPGSHIKVISSESLAESDIDICLLAVNAENDQKVIDNHQAFVNRGGRFIPVLPPSDNLLPFWSPYENAQA